MTDKQIIIDGKIKPITLEDVPTILELHKSKSFVEIAKMYGVTQNAIRYWVKKYNVKPLKQKDQIKILEEQLKRAEKTMQEIWDRLGKTSDELLRKEQECEELKNIINEAKNSKLDLNSFFAIEATVGEYQLELDQLKAEVKSKTEYIQEQRDIINQYSKEIEMYKKCQGKRASKREEELKAENGELKNRVAELSLFQLYKIQRDEAEQTLTEIREMLKEICMEECLFDWNKTNKKHCGDCDCRYGQILQKISEVEDGQ
jgi:DNA-binding Lrp family transcriptional regulator